MRRAAGMVLVAACALGSAMPVSAQTPVSATAAESFGAPLDSATATAIASIVDRARAAGLPVEPIVAKARLGVLRHAPAARIVAASRAVADRLAVARAALDPQPTAADIAAGADALGAGVNADALRSLRRAAPARPLAVPLGVLAQLVASGVPTARATTIVTDLVRRGAPAGQIVALGNAVDGDVRAGERADVSLGLRLRQLDAVLGPPGPGSSAATLCATTTAAASYARQDGICAGVGGGQKKP